MSVTTQHLRQLRDLRDQLYARYPPADIYDTQIAVALAESDHPHDRILAKIPESQRALAKVDDAAAQRILDAYVEARERVALRVQSWWERTLGAGTAWADLSAEDRVRLIGNLEVLDSLGVAEEHIRGQAAEAIQEGFDRSVLEAIKQSTFEQSVIADTYRIRDFGQPFAPPPGIAEEIGVNRAMEDATHIAQKTREAASRVLVVGALEGVGVNTLVSRLTPVFSGNGRRAELASRYVTIRSYNAARVTHYGQMQEVLAPFGRTIHKQWVTSVDDRACPICLALHGTTVSLETSFDISATFDAAHSPPKPWPDPAALTEPPRHARCRCSVVPWVDGWEHGTSFTPAAMQEQARGWARKAGYAPPQAPPRGAGPPAPTAPGLRLEAARVRALRRSQLEAAEASYLRCVYGLPYLPPLG